MKVFKKINKIMFISSFIINLLLLSNLVYAQAPAFTWAKQFGGDHRDACNESAIDELGNVYITGYFYGDAQFGDVTLSSAGSFDIYVAKLDATGNVLWVTGFGGEDWDEGLGIATDATGNCYVTGYFQHRAFFGDHLLTSIGISDIFIAKLDASGNVCWAKSAGGATTYCWIGDIGYGIATDAAGNCVVTGTFQETAYFDNIALTSAGDTDIFIAKYSPDGNLIWVIRDGGTENDVAKAIAIDSRDNCVITGWFTDNSIFGAIPLTSLGGRDIFIAKYNVNGAFQWIKPVGNSWAFDAGEAITADDLGNYIVTGNSYLNMFIAKYDSEGNILWEKEDGLGYDTGGNDVATDAEGNSYVTGCFYLSAAFDTVSLTSVQADDIFIVKYDPLGNFLWVKQAGGSSNEEGNSIIVISPDECYVMGRFSDLANFDSTTLNSPYNEEIFIAKLESSKQPHFAFTTTDESYSIVIDAATIDGVALDAGDEIGVFTAAGFCVGAAVWTGEVPAALVAWKDDSQTPSVIDGYQAGETMYFRVWDCSSGSTEDYEATPTYQYGDGTFGYSFYSRISRLEAKTTAEISVTYEFPQRGWYLISLPLTPPANDLNTLFPEALSAFAYNTITKNYTPVTSIEPGKGYWVLISMASSITVTGVPIHSFTAQYATGWHLIGTVAGTVNFTSPYDNPDGSVIAAYGYDPATQQYFSVYPPGTGELEQKSGYWLAVYQPYLLTIGDGAQSISTQTMITVNQAFYKNHGSQPPLPPYVEEQQALPVTEILSHNYPNPFNPQTIIEYNLPHSGMTQIHVYNALGQKMRTLVNEEQTAGIHRITWDGRNEAGESVANGIYLYRITNAGQVFTKKILLLK